MLYITDFLYYTFQMLGGQRERVSARYDYIPDTGITAYVLYHAVDL